MPRQKVTELSVEHLKEVLADGGTPRLSKRSRLLKAAESYMIENEPVGRFRDALDYFVILGGFWYPSKMLVACAVALLRCDGDFPDPDPETFPVDPNELAGGQRMKEVLEWFGYTVVELNRRNAHCVRFPPHRVR